MTREPDMMSDAKAATDVKTVDRTEVAADVMTRVWTAVEIEPVTHRDVKAATQDATREILRDALPWATFEATDAAATDAAGACATGAMP